MAKWLFALLLIMSLLVVGVPYAIVYVRAPADADRQVTPDSFLPVSLYQPDRNEIIEVPLEEYLKGVVAAEMPASFAEEALAAQAIVARTYLIRHMPAFGGAGCDATQLHKSPPRNVRVVDICADPRQGQAWLSAEQLRQRWGVLGFINNWSKVSKAVESTRGTIIVYKEEPIDAVYHAASGGVTEAAQDVWGNDVRYLKSVDSETEKGSRYWRTVKEMDLTEILARLGMETDALQNQIQRGEKIIRILGKSPTGRVMRIQVGDKVFNGREFREKLNLNSTWMEFQWIGRKLLITTRGYGHGVGMSQYGADGMARQGNNARQIIEHYYPGIKLRQIFSE